MQIRLGKRTEILLACAIPEMNWIEMIAHCTVAVIFLIGLVSALLPVIPGSLIVWLGVLTHQLWMTEASVGWKVVASTGVLTLIGLIGDLFLGLWGARKFGASWKGAVGAILGACIGFVLPPPIFWLIVGPIVGAVIGELAAGRTWQAGSKAGVGTILGAALAFALKFGLSVCVVALFYLSLLL